jgi:putative membrane protein
MYSVFIGLTLGGVPVLWQMARPAANAFWVGLVAGLIVMAGLAWLQVYGGSTSGTREGMVMMFIAGIAGASAMILPGVSGGYLLLVLGVYVPVLSAIDALKEALKAGDIASATDPVLAVVLPVGVGVGVGILVVSNLIRRLLERHEQPTLGALMGLLVGAVFGLWPFQEGVPPKIGEVFKGRPLTAERLAELTPDKYPTEIYTPTFTNVMMALGLFQVRGGAALEPVYEVTSPVFQRVTFHLDRRYYPGERFEIIARGSSARNPYIQSATLDGESLEKPWFYHRQLVDGGSLVLELGPEPNKGWGSRVGNAPPSMSGEP